MKMIYYESDGNKMLTLWISFGFEWLWTVNENLRYKLALISKADHCRVDLPVYGQGGKNHRKSAKNFKRRTENLIFSV